MITRAKISAVRANSFVIVEQFIVFFLVIRNSSNKCRIGGAALINFFVPDAALIRVNMVGEVKGKGKRYLTSDVPLLSREYSPRKATVRSVYSPLSISAPF